MRYYKETKGDVYAHRMYSGLLYELITRLATVMGWRDLITNTICINVLEINTKMRLMFSSEAFLVC